MEDNFRCVEYIGLFQIGTPVYCLVYFTVSMLSTTPPIVSESMLIAEAKQIAIRLAEALAASSLTEKEKESWAVLIPELRLDQLSRLAVVLDASVEKAVRADLADVIEKIRVILEKHAAVQVQLDSEFMTGIGSIVQDLRRAEAVAKN